jgi:hypothetical protein
MAGHKMLSISIARPFVEAHEHGHIGGNNGSLLYIPLQLEGQGEIQEKPS